MSKLESAGTKELFLLRVDQIEKNNFNPNVMAPDKFEALKGDVVDGKYDSILVSPSEVFYTKYDGIEHRDYVIVDGYWRWKAAVDSGLEEIKCEIQDLTEERAQVVAYGKGYSRGSFDPIKEAELFKLDVDNKMSAARIAEKYGVISESYVKNRLQLLKISPTVKQLYEKPVEAFKPAKADELAHEMRSEEELDAEPPTDLRQMAEGRAEKIVPRGTLTTSHLEAISALPEEYQKRISLQIIERELTIRQTEEMVKEAKKEIHAHRAFEAALEKAVQKVCPTCGSAPEDWKERSWMVDRDPENRQFNCSRRGCYTIWDPNVVAKDSPKKKLDFEEVAKREAEERVRKMREGRENPTYILIEGSNPELHELTVPWLLAKLKDFSWVSRIDVRGKIGDEKVELEYHAPTGSSEFGRYNLSFKKGGEDFYAASEQKTYKRTGKTMCKVDLTWGKGTPEVRARGRWFFQELVKTGGDPFLPKDPQEVRKILEIHGEGEVHAS